MKDIILILCVLAIGAWGFFCTRGLTNLLSDSKK